MGNADSLLSQGLDPGVALPLPPGAAGSLQGLVAKCTALLAGQKLQEEEDAAAACKELVDMLQLVTGFTGFGAGGVVRTALPPEVVAGTAKLFCNSLPRHLARAQQLTPAWLSLLETQLSVLCWRGELGLTAQQVARALATLLPATQRGLTSLAMSNPDKALELRARMLTTVACMTDPPPGADSGNPTPWAAALRSSPAATKAAARLACDVCSQLPTQEDIRIGFGIHPGDDARALPNELEAARGVLLACDVRRLLDKGQLGVGELQTLTGAALRVLDHFHAPFRPPIMEAEAFTSAAELLVFALGKQGSVAKAGAHHPAGLPRYSADQLRRLVVDAHKMSRLSCLLANSAAEAGDGQQAGGRHAQACSGVLAALGKASMNLRPILDAAQDSAAVLADAETARQAMEAAEAMMRTGALALLHPSALDPGAGGSEFVEMLPLRGVYTQLLEHLKRIPAQVAAAADLLRPAQALAMTAVKLRRCNIQLFVDQAEQFLDEIDDPELLVDVDLLSCLAVAARVLQARPGLLEGQHVTQHLRTAGFVVFASIPALLRSNAHSTGGTQMLDLAADLGLVDEAVRAGLGKLLFHEFNKALELHDSDEACLYILATVTAYSMRQGASSVALAVVEGGLLGAAVDWSQKGLLRRRNTDINYLAGPRLLRALAAALDTASGSSLCTQHANLLAGVPTNCFGARPLEASDVHAPWARRFQREATWRAVRAQLLPALAALCAQLTHGSEERNALFREVALSAVSCTNPHCTNMAGPSEAELPLMTCKGCREARYCCRQCQRSDWKRHKPLCAALREAKVSE